MSWIKSLAVIASSTLLSLLVAELVLSMFKPVAMRSDPKWVVDGHTKGHFKPGQVIKASAGHNVANPFLRKEFSEYTLNKFGFRGADWIENKDHTMMFIGGSSTFNFHDSDDQTWPELFRECVNKKEGKDYQGVNLSQPGYSIFDAPHLFIQKGYRYDPGVMVVYHLWNDIKVIAALAENPDFLMSAGVASNSVSLKSILLNYKILPNLVGNLHIALKTFTSNQSENAYSSTGNPIKNDDILLALSEIKKRYETLLLLLGPEKKVILIKQGLLLDKDNNEFDQHISYNLIGLSKSQFLKSQSLYYEMIDGLAKNHRNVLVFDADKLIPKNLEYYEDHVHLQRKAQILLATGLCAAWI